MTAVSSQSNHFLISVNEFLKKHKKTIILLHLSIHHTKKTSSNLRLTKKLSKTTNSVVEKSENNFDKTSQTLSRLQN